jgi:hypothetical protein
MKKGEGPPDATLMMFGSHRRTRRVVQSALQVGEPHSRGGKCVTGANSADVITDLELAFRLLAGHGRDVRWLTPAAQRINFPVFRGTHSEGAASAGAAPKLSSTHSKLR